MSEQKGHLAWLPQGTRIWNYNRGVSRILRQPFYCLVLEQPGPYYEVLYDGGTYNVAKNHVTIMNEEEENSDS